MGLSFSSRMAYTNVNDLSLLLIMSGLTGMGCARVQQTPSKLTKSIVNTRTEVKRRDAL